MTSTDHVPAIRRHLEHAQDALRDEPTLADLREAQKHIDYAKNLMTLECNGREVRGGEDE